MRLSWPDPDMRIMLVAAAPRNQEIMGIIWYDQ